ncbi:MAG: TlpA disulfide reductase family protein [Pseudomonadota bacterium]|nr:TlpA disulfide reductase family protein [Pseudomonadota bacterium]
MAEISPRRAIRGVFIAALIALGTPAGAADFPRLDEPAFAVGDYAGDVVLLDFWASWCVPCKSSFPWMSRMQEKYRADGLQVIAVNVDQDKFAAAEFMHQYRSEFTVVFDPEGVIAKEYALLGMPSSYVLDRSGAVLWSHKGFRVRDEAALEARLVDALQRQAAN